MASAYLVISSDGQPHPHSHPLWRHLVVTYSVSQSVRDSMLPHHIEDHPCLCTILYEVMHSRQDS